MSGLDQSLRPADFIIVGAMKSGTTSLHHWLMSSDEIFMREEEVHFFNRDERYAPNAEAYGHFLGLKNEVSSKVRIGDDTPSYSYLEKVPARIHKVCPKAKIIWVLRDPLHRSISQYWHAARQGSELRDINQAFRDELSGQENDIWKLYLYRSKYLWQIKNYLEYFDLDQMLFVDFAKLIKGDKEQCRRITEFLDIGPLYTEIPHSNETAFFPRPFVNQCLSYMTFLPRKVSLGVRAIFGYSKNKKPQLDPEIALRANDYFSDDFEELRKITGLNIFKRN